MFIFKNLEIKIKKNQLSTMIFCDFTSHYLCRKYMDEMTENVIGIRLVFSALHPQKELVGCPKESCHFIILSH